MPQAVVLWQGAGETWPDRIYLSKFFTIIPCITMLVILGSCLFKVEEVPEISKDSLQITTGEETCFEIKASDIEQMGTWYRLCFYFFRNNV
jgi:hypothetical protein